MIAAVSFYATPFSRINRHFPVSSIESYRTITIQDVSMMEDLSRIVSVPIFAGWENVNMARIGNDYFWVIARRHSTRNKAEVVFTIEYNAVTTLCMGGRTVSGHFDRIPTRDRTMPFVIGDDTLKLGRFEEFTTINKAVITPSAGGSPIELPVFYVQVTYSYFKDPVTGETDNEVIMRYGCFVAFDNTKMPPFPKADLYLTDMQSGVRYPTLYEIITDIDLLMDFPADSIVDVSVSRRCPWSYGFDGAKGYTIPLAKAEVFSKSGQPSITMIRLDRRPNDTWFSNQQPDVGGLISLNLSNFEADCGLISLVSDTGQLVTPIPARYIKDTPWQVYYHTFSDYNGIYTVVKIGEADIVIPEGKIPWVGSIWNEYKIREMALDRDVMNFNIQMGRIDMVQSIFSSAAGAVGSLIKGDVGGAAKEGMNVTNSIIDTMQSEAGLRFAQDIKERRMQNSPQTYQNFGYGLIFMEAASLMDRPISGKNYTAGVKIEMPTLATINDYNEFIREFGFPSWGKKNVSISGSGYVRGRTTENIVPGYKGELFNVELVSGFRFGL